MWVAFAGLKSVSWLHIKVRLDLPSLSEKTIDVRGKQTAPGMGRYDASCIEADLHHHSCCSGLAQQTVSPLHVCNSAIVLSLQRVRINTDADRCCAASLSAAVSHASAELLGQHSPMCSEFIGNSLKRGHIV